MTIDTSDAAMLALADRLEGQEAIPSRSEVSAALRAIVAERHGQRMCVVCGLTKPATDPRETPHPDCPAQDACTFDMTDTEAADHWRKKYHDLQQAGVQVKPLVWLGGEGFFCANTTFRDVMDEWSIYVVEEVEESNSWGMWPPGCDDDPASIHPTEQDGFAAAHADYEARIRAALKGPNDD